MKLGMKGWNTLLMLWESILVWTLSIYVVIIYSLFSFGQLILVFFVCFQGNNNIGDVGAKYISECLKTNSTLNELALGQNSFSFFFFDQWSFLNFENVKWKGRNKIGEEGVMCLAQSLPYNFNLEYLGLGIIHFFLFFLIFNFFGTFL